MKILPEKREDEDKYILSDYKIKKKQYVLNRTQTLRNSANSSMV